MGGTSSIRKNGAENVPTSQPRDLRLSEEEPSDISTIAPTLNQVAVKFASRAPDRGTEGPHAPASHPRPEQGEPRRRGDARARPARRAGARAGVRDLRQRPRL